MAHLNHFELDNFFKIASARSTQCPSFKATRSKAILSIEGAAGQSCDHMNLSAPEIQGL